MKSEAIKFIDQIKPDALEVQTKTGIPAAVIIAQACLETGFGRRLCIDGKTKQNSRNLFNIKGAGPAGSVECWTAEYYNGKKQRVLAKFRAYNSFQESFADHSQLLLKPRYAPCLAVKENPREFAMKLQQCGYATDPNYGLKLVKIIEIFNLEELTSPPKQAKTEKIAIIMAGKRFSGLLIDNVAYAPARTVFESIGYQVTWEGDTKTVIVSPP